MIPEFDDKGFLPPGIHRATRQEFEDRFAYFARSDQRLRVYEKLKRLLDEAGRMEAVKRVYIAGSFVTRKAEPNDFDCLIALDPDMTDREWRPIEYQVASRPMSRRAFGGDVLAFADESRTFREYLEFFQKNKNNEPVGIIEIQL